VPCLAGRLGVVLSERGEVSACETRRGEPLGNVREAGYDVPAILRSARARRVLADVAGGGCHCAHECNLLVSLLADPTSYPRLAREWLRPAPGSSRGTDRATDPPAPAVPGGGPGAVERRTFA
jgi:hypothetical protein